MGEKKVRAWRPYAKQMEYSDTALLWNYPANDLAAFLHWLKAHSAEYRLMWGIGRQDRNRRDIYEGDIVQIHRTKSRGVVVEADDPLGGYTIEQHTGRALFFTSTYDSCNRCDGFRGWESIEVIGNVWQTPELIGREVKR